MEQSTRLRRLLADNALMGCWHCGLARLSVRLLLCVILVLVLVRVLCMLLSGRRWVRGRLLLLVRWLLLRCRLALVRVGRMLMHIRWLPWPILLSCARLCRQILLLHMWLLHMLLPMLLGHRRAVP